MGWAGLANGELLAAAEQAGFDMIVTGDQSIPRQNDFSGSRLAVVVPARPIGQRFAPARSRSATRSSGRRGERAPPSLSRAQTLQIAGNGPA